jgi:hypothetical protein
VPTFTRLSPCSRMFRRRSRSEVDQALRMELLKTAIEYKVEANTIAENNRRRGRTCDDPNMPRPEDVSINMLTGEVAMRHPVFLNGGVF